LFAVKHLSALSSSAHEVRAIAITASTSTTMRHNHQLLCVHGSTTTSTSSLLIPSPALACARVAPPDLHLRGTRQSKTVYKTVSILLTCSSHLIPSLLLPCFTISPHTFTYPLTCNTKENINAVIHPRKQMLARSPSKDRHIRQTMHALAFAGGEGAVDDEAGGRVFVVDVVIGRGVAGDVGGGGAGAGFVYLLWRREGVLV